MHLPPLDALAFAHRVWMKLKSLAMPCIHLVGWQRWFAVFSYLVARMNNILSFTFILEGSHPFGPLLARSFHQNWLLVSKSLPRWVAFLQYQELASGRDFSPFFNSLHIILKYCIIKFNVLILGLIPIQCSLQSFQQ